MSLLLVFFLSGLFLATLLFFLFKLKFSKKNIEELQKEVEIQISRFKKQQAQSQENINRLSSLMFILTETVREISSSLRRETDSLQKEVLKVLFERANILLKPAKSILLVSSHSGFKCLYSLGYPSEVKEVEVKEGGKFGLVGWAIETKRFISLYDIELDPTLAYLAEENPFECSYCQPIEIDSKVKAVLCMDGINPSLEKNLVARLFFILGSVGSVALHNAIFTEIFRERSLRDSLTGLYNHAYFQNYLQGALRNSFLENKPLSLVMIDVDHFKLLNDTYGHQLGDTVLKEIAIRLKNLFVDTYLGICARYGGEEFSAVFLEMKKEETLPVIECFRKEVSEIEFYFRDIKVKVSLSAGIVDTHQKDKNLSREELIYLADKALYQAKREGRNRVILGE